MTPQSAEACSFDPCGDFKPWGPLNAANGTLVPTDGVFVIHGEHNNLDPIDLSTITISVTKDGDTVEGAAEVSTGLRDTFIWRPDGALEAGATYTVEVSLDNEESGGEYCNIDAEPTVATLSYTVGDSPAPTLAPPTLSSSETITTSMVLTSLEDLVCCDGAMPYVDQGGCTNDAYWDEGTCVSTKQRGRVTSAWELTDDLAQGLVGMVYYRQMIDGEFFSASTLGPIGWTQASSFCATVELVSLADGSVATSPEHCFGADPAEPLGVYDVEDATCGEGSYVCEVDGDAWDPDLCTDVDDSGGSESETSGSDSDSDSETTDTASDTGDQDGEGGCVCATTEGTWSPGFAFLGLIFLRRRRRQ